MTNKGVTIVELVVVLGIIGVLVGMSFPAINSIRERSQETVCQNNIRQINLACTMYLDGAKRLPPPSRVGFAEGWTFKLLSFMDQDNLVNSIPMDTLIVDVEEAASKPPETLRCPTRAMLGEESIDGIPVAHYVIVGSNQDSDPEIWDAPLSLKAAWLNSPELPNIGSEPGPHNKGYFWARSRRSEVKFRLPTP